MKDDTSRRGEVLVAILKSKSDLPILLEQGWYRVPVANAPRGWPPECVAFYQPKAFGKDAYQVRYYGEVANIQVEKRKQLFPNELPSVKSEKEYYKILLKNLKEREQPIPSIRPRRLVFVPTTWRKFVFAEQINDLFDNSLLEDRLWDKFKELDINAERQWSIFIKQRYYRLDFALFCNDGQINVEADGDTWYIKPARAAKDNQRNNDLASEGWYVLRFTSKQINEQMAPYCLDKISETINHLGGLSEERIIPREFFLYNGKISQQWSLFEDRGKYVTDEAEPIEAYDE